MINNEFIEAEHPRDEKGRFTEKEYTEKNYTDFHKMFYEENTDAVYITKRKGNDFFIDESFNKSTKLSDGNFSNLEKYFNSKNILKLKLPNKKIKGKNEFKEDKKSLEDFINKGFEVKAKYNDGYNTSFILEKKENKENLIDKIKNIKLEKYKPTTYIIDWGKQKQQGKRVGKMVIGAMGDVSLQGKKEYTNILGSFSEEEQKSAKELFKEKHEQYLYAQAREYGLKPMEAEKLVLSVYNSLYTHTFIEY